MARSFVKLSTSPTHSSQDPHARNGSSAWNEASTKLSVARRLTRKDLPLDTEELARYLIESVLVRALPEGLAGGRIVETEAYVVGDAASHAYRGRTQRNQTLFLERGRVYVYLAYGSSFMLNVSSEAAGVGAGVLIRAIEPTIGFELMRQNRPVSRLADLTRGPGRLCAALRIDRTMDGVDLCEPGPLWLERSNKPADVGRSKRIGITKETERPLRFYVRGNPFVSGPKALNG